MDSPVLYSLDADGIATITLNRPELRNPISDLDLIEALLDTLTKMEDDPKVRVAILTGAGAAFSAGGNLKIDMAAKQFTAHANVRESGNTHSVDAVGGVDYRGYLQSDPAKSNSELYGVVNGNLKTVGSVFDKSLGDGRSLTGTMVWHR